MRLSARYILQEKAANRPRPRPTDAIARPEGSRQRCVRLAPRGEEPSGSFLGCAPGACRWSSPARRSEPRGGRWSPEPPRSSERCWRRPADIRGNEGVRNVLPARWGERPQGCPRDAKGEPRLTHGICSGPTSPFGKGTQQTMPRERGDWGKRSCRTTAADQQTGQRHQSAAARARDGRAWEGLGVEGVTGPDAGCLSAESNSVSFALAFCAV